MDAKKTILLIGGIHGVGKTFFCTSIQKKLSINIYSASDLIAKEKNTVFKKDKLIKNIADNQNFLYLAVQKLADSKLILDGHFSLLNKNQEVEKIPFEIFKELPISFITVIEADPCVIKDRLEKRDRRKWDVILLDKFQKVEISYAKEIAVKLKIDFVLLKSDDYEFFIKNYLTNSF